MGKDKIEEILAEASPAAKKGNPGRTGVPAGKRPERSGEEESPPYGPEWPEGKQATFLNGGVLNQGMHGFRCVDPVAIAELMMRHNGLPMLGCQHAYIATGGLLDIVLPASELPKDCTYADKHPPWVSNEQMPLL